MSRRAGASVFAVAGAGVCATVSAQTPSYTYAIQVANPILMPGETTTVSVLCGFAPGIGSPIATPFGPAFMSGVARGGFDLAADDGSWLLGSPPGGSLIPPFNFGGMNQGVAVGPRVTGVLWGSGWGPPLVTLPTLNPTPLWSATFTAPSDAGRVTLVLNPDGPHGAWVHLVSQFPAVEIGVPTPTAAHAVINVIPAPSALTLLALAAAGAPRRQRPTRCRREPVPDAAARSAIVPRPGDPS